MDNTKTCKSCGETKHEDDFTKADGKNRKPRNRCKVCTTKNADVRKKLKLENPVPEAGKCRICKRHTDKWVLDHCHKTDTFRGYICKDCNSGIGLLQDRIVLLWRAVVYLIFHKVKLLWNKKHFNSSD